MLNVHAHPPIYKHLLTHIYTPNNRIYTLHTPHSYVKIVLQMNLQTLSRSFVYVNELVKTFSRAIKVHQS